MADDQHDNPPPQEPGGDAPRDPGDGAPDADAQESLDHAPAQQHEPDAQPPDSHPQTDAGAQPPATPRADAPGTAEQHHDPATPEQPQPASGAPDADAPTPEQAVDAAEQGIDAVDDAATQAGPSGPAEDILAAARAAVAQAASAANAPPAPRQPEIPTDIPAEALGDEPAGARPGPSQPAAAEEPTERLSGLHLPALDDAPGAEDAKGIDLLADVNLDVTIELGRTGMLVEDVLKLGEGAVVELDKLAGDPVDVYVNDRLIARGEVLVLNDTFCIRVNEIVKQGADAVAEAG